MPGEVNLRSYEPDDAPAVNRLLNQGPIKRELFEPPLISDAERRDMISPGPLNRHLVAESEGQIVAYGSLETGNRRRAHTGSISFAVAPNFWGQGIGTTVLVALLDLADNWYNVRRLSLQIFVDNSRAIHILERHGFEIEATHEAYALREGNLASAHTLARLRNDPAIVEAPHGTALNPPV
jgi:putative acetyltransferase